MIGKKLGPCVVLIGVIVLSSCTPEPGVPQETVRSRLCGGVLSTTGAVEKSRPQPDDVGGCWPVGVWKFRASFEQMDCETAPVLEPEYAVEVVREDFVIYRTVQEQVESYRYLNDPENQNVSMKVTSGGGGLCQATIEISSDDGLQVLSLKPTLEADRSIRGFGEYDVFVETLE